MLKKLTLASVASAFVLTALATATPAAARVDLFIGTAPPKERVEVVPAPRRGYVWAPGYWNWSGRHHVWVKGHWVHERRGYNWVADRWDRDGDRFHYVPGHWER